MPGKKVTDHQVHRYKQHRTVLSKCAALAHAQWELVPGAHGRPRIADPGREIALLSFTISHTHGTILVGVTRSSDFGADVESLGARVAPLNIARSQVARTTANGSTRRRLRPRRRYSFAGGPSRSLTLKRAASGWPQRLPDSAFLSIHTARAPSSRWLATARSTPFRWRVLECTHFDADPCACRELTGPADRATMISMCSTG